MISECIYSEKYRKTRRVQYPSEKTLCGNVRNHAKSLKKKILLFLSQKLIINTPNIIIDLLSYCKNLFLFWHISHNSWEPFGHWNIPLHIDSEPLPKSLNLAGRVPDHRGQQSFVEAAYSSPCCSPTIGPEATKISYYNFANTSSQLSYSISAGNRFCQSSGRE